ncbi:contact-dependent growth inhibition system immunity protein [Neisseria sicca]|uniref:contact-dependent growth inhibition system immunity protein n=1 Tax=Neisseria sicca TaxID=490 RepID=UPI0019595920|nr:contact-dependent growth inhibition system immunity protein [Neisseria sicca]VTX68036.1 Immunity protein CdiI-o11 [Neisseria sicca]
MTFNQEQDYWAGYKANERALIIQTWSGFGRYAPDHLYPPHILPLDADNETLGTTVLQALANSRTLDNEAERIDFLKQESFKPRYEDWVANLCGNLGYKTRRALFKNMMSGDIWLHNGCLKISPSRHVKLEAWDAIDADDVILSLDNSPEEIGAGLRLALSRCR